MSQQLTREQAAQMTFNALKADVVKYGTGVTVTTTDGTGIKVTGGRETETTTASWGNAISGKLSNGDRIVQLGEQLYKGDLQLTEGYDDFGRPDCDTWTYKGREIVTMQASTDHLVTTYVGKVKYQDIYNDLGSAVVNKAYQFDSYVDGYYVEQSKSLFTKSNDDGLVFALPNKTMETGNSVYTELYSEYDADWQGYWITIVTINTYLAEASGGYNSSKNTLGITVDGNANASGVTAPTLNSYTLDAEDVKGALDAFSAKDKLLFTCAYVGGSGNNTLKYEVKEVYAPTVLEAATVTNYGVKSSDRTQDSVTADGVKYSYSRNDSAESSYKSLVLSYETNSNNIYDIYLDAYGNVVYAKGSNGVGRYVFVRELGREYNGFGNNGNGNWNGDVKAKITGTDGENKTVTLSKYYKLVYNANTNRFAWSKCDADDESVFLQDGYLTVNKWYKYSINSDGNYLLYELNDDLTQNDNRGSTSGTTYFMSKSTPDLFGDGSAIANGSTVFIVKDKKADTTTVYKGISKLPDITITSSGGAYAIMKPSERNYATYVYITSSDVKDSTNLHWAFVRTTNHTVGYDTTNKEDTYTYDAVIEGEETTITVLNPLEAGAGLYYWYTTKHDYPNDLEKVNPYTGNFDVDWEQIVEVGERLAATLWIDGDVYFEDGTLTLSDYDGSYHFAIASDADVWFVNDKNWGTTGGDVHKGSVSSVVFNEYEKEFTGFVYFVTRSTSDQIISEVYFLGTGKDNSVVDTSYTNGIRTIKTNNSDHHVTVESIYPYDGDEIDDILVKIYDQLIKDKTCVIKRTERGTVDGNETWKITVTTLYGDQEYFFAPAIDWSWLVQ